ncbi:MAG: hypothetical protein VX768_16190 [Planctomycetota bacterium]|nr:hypothetical protein [Planctomycetota bacterium]
MNPNTRFSLSAQLLLMPFLTAVLASTVMAQTVGDTFIDTSEWVQSSSPISDGYTTQGYITETIVRGYRGPGRSPVASATEFSPQSGIQPVVYENSRPGNLASRAISLARVNGWTPEPLTVSTEAEAPLRPTPDPLVQAANRGVSPTVNASPLSGMRGAPHLDPRVSQANYIGPGQAASLEPPVQVLPVYSQTAGIVPPGMMQVEPGYLGLSSGRPFPVTTPTTFQNWAPAVSHAPSAVPVATFANPSTLRNCCDPIYVQTQFVTPGNNSGAGNLQTYPQYNGNPYPKPGFGISQPFVRSTWVPIVPLRSMPYGTYLGQGVIGQPVAYVEGEPVRNFLRYVFP